LTALPPFQALLDQHAAEVMSVLRGAVGRGDAEDCFQETFLAALRAYPKLRDTRNLRGWLLTIAYRKAIDHHRSNGRRPLPVAEVAEMATVEPAASQPGFGRIDTGAEVWNAVGALPPKQRAAVALRFACDLPHTEIGAALGCSTEAARRNLHEGIKRLRKELA
jgi:RNA polymerase sigma factor (sigma-70 family)